ncbi:hypothetical protein B0G75_103155 [Paraburkholderia sp. BL18I3N2]|uniref:hypothetical protein n=1 Tax=Paraburkholderia sp. BL18I3N2 TaxID=1938799 RepID=UPI000D066C8E|nr:hypothetical protein [Paraburkholderia sp. BL18I3N2]PRX32928.1 hypothetical protein B0G75_103155 [Paraburkholderia sp. BL18I3N2]
MKRFVEGDDREQVALLPECVDDYIGQHIPVSVIDRPCDSTAFSAGQVLVKESEFKSAGTKERERSFAIVGDSNPAGSQNVRDRLIDVRIDRIQSSRTSCKHRIRRRTKYVAI